MQPRIDNCYLLETGGRQEIKVCNLGTETKLNRRMIKKPKANNKKQNKNDMLGTGRYQRHNTKKLTRDQQENKFCVKKKKKKNKDRGQVQLKYTLLAKITNKYNLMESFSANHLLV